jgi:hypothetical protein
MQRILYEVKRGGGGTGPLSRARAGRDARAVAPARGGRAGAREDAHGQDPTPAPSAASSSGSSSLPTCSRPDLVGTRMYNQRSGEFSTVLGPGIHQPAARRRDQPCARQGTERAARGDAGAPGDDRRGDPQGARAVPGDGDAEPDRDRGHLSPARGAGRPLHDEGARRLSERGGGVRDRRARHRARDRRRRGRHHRAALRAAERVPQGPTSIRRSSSTR